MNLPHLIALTTAATLSAAGCGPAPAAPKTASSDAYFVGVWTTSNVSYDEAARATAAARFAADGTFANGVWDAKAGFTAGAAAGPTRGFVARYEIDAPAKAITFLLDGAEERATFAIEGPDRWKTVATTAEGTFVVHYRRKQ